MFTGFKLNIDESRFKAQFIESEKPMEYYEKIGEKYLNEQKKIISDDLDKYIVDGIINGTSLEEDWFPMIKADIFISHSHQDEKLVLALAGWIYDKFKVKCFIDSCVWGYINDLLEKLNDEYSNKREDEKNGGVLYSHSKCNIVASHVNMMLNIALQKMIDNTEAIILINTTNSIKIDVKNGSLQNYSTYSPWIYSEIICSEIVRKKELSEYRPMEKLEELYHFYDKKLKIKYDISVNHLNDLDCNDLIEWEKGWKKYKNINKYPLDQLYKITNPTEFDKIIKIEMAKIIE